MSVVTISLYSYANRYLDKQVYNAVQKAVEDCGADVSWEDLSYSFLFSTLTFKNIVFSFKDMTIKSDAVSFSDIDFEYFKNPNFNLNRGVHAKAYNISISAGDLLNGIDVNNIGISGVNADIDVSLCDIDNYVQFSFKTEHIGGWGELSARVILDGLTGESFSSILKDISRKQVVFAEYIFRDYGFVNNIVEYFSKHMSLSQQRAKYRMLDAINRRIHNYYKDDSPERVRLTQLYRFIDNEGAVKLTYGGEGIPLKDFIPYKESGWRSLLLWFSKQPYVIVNI